MATLRDATCPETVQNTDRRFSVHILMVWPSSVVSLWHGWVKIARVHDVERSTCAELGCRSSAVLPEACAPVSIGADSVPPSCSCVGHRRHRLHCPVGPAHEEAAAAPLGRCWIYGSKWRADGPHSAAHERHVEPLADECGVGWNEEEPEMAMRLSMEGVHEADPWHPVSIKLHDCGLEP